jgi:hypothetical protein
VVAGLCLDDECLCECGQRQIYAYGGYERVRPPQVMRATWPDGSALVKEAKYPRAKGNIRVDEEQVSMREDVDESTDLTEPETRLVVLCLDDECLCECGQRQIYAYGGYERVSKRRNTHARKETSASTKNRSRCGRMSMKAPTFGQRPVSAPRTAHGKIRHPRSGERGSRAFQHRMALDPTRERKHPRRRRTGLDAGGCR